MGQSFSLFRLPFNWKTPIGYSFAFLLASGSAFAVAYTILPTACFAIGSYWLAIVVVKDIINDFHLRCDKISTENGKKTRELKEHLCDVIKDITDVKQLSSFFFSNKIRSVKCVLVFCF